MKGLEIRLYGVVQGVGFRPFVARLAKTLGLLGWVTNEGGAVRIVLKGEANLLERFLQELERAKPGPSIILHREVVTVDPAKIEAEDFTIKDSVEKEEDLVFLPPDLSLCAYCGEELNKQEDRRSRHPFISCMLCGPRYTIIDRVPYDRENTVMHEFPMCSHCQEEYYNIQDRRYHAQTVSCFECGPVLLYQEKPDGPLSRGEEALDKAINALQQGKILAVKGIGGYHFACTPFLDGTVQALRDLKGREAKPFAVQFPDLSSIADYCRVDEAARQALLAAEKPIVLLPKKEKMTGRVISSLVDQDSLDYGAFLPYTPLQVLLLAETGPLIMTSANLSGQPILKHDEEVLAIFHPDLAGVLYHRRKIRAGVDDSVVRCVNGGTQVVRRARGYVPLPIILKHGHRPRGKRPNILACGGMLKNTFCLVKQNFAYLSQHLGDLEEARAWDEYRENLARMMRLFKIRPEIIACDLHPDYPTSRLARTMSEQPVRVQHHHAHILSVMAEHGLDGEVLGLAFDGTGYGSDGKIWGGEFLVSTPAGFERAGHLEYTPLPGGDDSIREGWKAAAFYLYRAKLEGTIADARWPLLKAAWQAGINTVESSSMGRLFDAVSSLLDICQVSAYEGEGAIKLEAAAVRWLVDKDKRKLPLMTYDIFKERGVYRLGCLPLVRRIMEEKEQGAPPGYLAAGFHLTIARACVEMAREICRERGLQRVVLSGGVFQNRLLLEEMTGLLHACGLEVYYNIQVPPNDGGISLGQALAAFHQI